MEKAEDEIILITDGGYDGQDNIALAKEKNVRLITTALIGKEAPDVLSKLVEVAKIQSTGASNRIEGIHTTDQRLQELKDEHVAPANRDEEENPGYRTVLETIHESHDYIGIKSSIILQLHRDLYKFSPYSFGGTFKSTDNIIQETDAAGIKRVRFQPVPAYETAASVDALCNAYNEIVGRKKAEPLLADMLFKLDFLCSHPFNDGNGRMSRLLTLLLLYRHGYMAGFCGFQPHAFCASMKRMTFRPWCYKIKIRLSFLSLRRLYLIGSREGKRMEGRHG